MSPNIYYIRVPEESLLSRTTQAAFDCADLSLPEYFDHGTLPRLSAPERFTRFAVPWTDDRGRVRTAHGFFAGYWGDGPADGELLLRDDLSHDEIQTLAFLKMLTCRLLDSSAEVAVFGLDRDPSSMSGAESMRLCQSFSLALHRCGLCLPESALRAPVPRRESGYLAAQRAALRPRRPERSSEEVFSPGQAAGCGVCLLAGEALRRVSGVRLEGKTAAVYGGGQIAVHAAKKAARLGMRVLRRARFRSGDDADLLFFCDPGAPLDALAAAELASLRPHGVFEGAYMACTPEAGALLARAGVLFVPAVAAGAGASAVPERTDSLWEAKKRLRAAMDRVLRRAWDARPGELYRGAYAAAVRSAADTLISRGAV